MEEHTETLDEFLKQFEFFENEALPTNCKDPYNALHGHKEGRIGTPPRLIFQCKDTTAHPKVGVYLDIDSVLGNFEVLPLTEAMMIYPNPPQWLNITGSHQYHRRPGGRKPVLIDKTPHCLFGEVGLSWKIHVIFPSLPYGIIPEGQDYVTSAILDTWYDSVVYPALVNTIPSEKQQHFSPSRQIFIERNPGIKMGHLLQSDYILQVTREMRTIVSESESLSNMFNGFFFHAACKGIKGSTSVPLEKVMDPDGFKEWRSSISSVYCDLFGEAGKKRLQIDIGAEFTATKEESDGHGPIHMLWRKEATQVMRMGLRQAPKLFEWWLADEVAGSTVSAGQANIVDFDMDIPSITYFQTYHLSKMSMPDTKNQQMQGIQGVNMTWGDKTLRASWEKVARGVQVASKTSWGCRMEIRMASRHLHDSSGLLGYLQVCHFIQSQASKHFLFLPSMKVAQYQAANLWLIREGAQRVEKQIAECHGTIDTGLKAFMIVLANLYRGFYRGILFAPQRTTVFGPMLALNETSYGLGYALRRYGYPRLPTRKVDWTKLRASIDGLSDDQFVRGSRLEGSRMSVSDLHSMVDVDLEHFHENAPRTAEELAGYIVGLLKDDMVKGSRMYQDAGTMATWSLEEARQAMSHRVERHISRRRVVNSWRKLFSTFFPILEDPDLPYVQPGRWTQVKYLPFYLRYHNLIEEHEVHLPQSFRTKFRQELWRLFDRMKCAIRPSIAHNFIQVVGGKICIDLRNQEDLILTDEVQ